MWEVMNEEEWNTIYQILRDKNRNIIWINGKSTDECDDPQKVQGQCGTDTEATLSKTNNSHCTYLHRDFKSIFCRQTQITSDRPVGCAASNNCQLVHFSANERRELATACP